MQENELKTENNIEGNDYLINNFLDYWYQEILQVLLETKNVKQDRTGTGTKSIFGRTFNFSMSYGFPLLTTKKISFKNIVHELLWFLKGDTNIKHLVDNEVHIWDGDAYARYLKEYEIFKIKDDKKLS